MDAGGGAMMGDGGYHFVEDAMFPQEEIKVPAAVSHQNEEKGLGEPLRRSVRWKWPRLHSFRHRRIGLAQAPVQQQQEQHRMVAAALLMRTSLDLKNGSATHLLSHSEYTMNVPTLFDAVTDGNLRDVHKLLRAGASGRNAALLHAICIDNTPAVEALLVAGVSVTGAVIHHVAAVGCADVLVALMCYARAVNKVTELLNARNTNGETALHVAVKAAHIQTTIVLLAEGCPCNAKSFLNGATALHEAVLRRNSRLIYALLRHGRGTSVVLPDGAMGALANIKEESCVPTTANEVGFRLSRRPAQLIHTVVATEGARVLEDLLKTELVTVRAKDRYGYTAVHIAALRGEVGVMASLLDSGASVDDKEFSRGRAPLHIAACQGYYDVVRLLIEYGAPVDQKEEEDRTPMHLAVLNEHVSVVTLLLGGGACDSEDRSGCTALRYAVRSKQEEIVYIYAAHYEKRRIVGAIEEEELDRSGLGQRDSSGRSLLHDAVRTGCHAMVQALLCVGARILFQDNLGQSPSHYAATAADNVSIISDLLHHDSRAMNALDHAGRTPLHIAVSTGHTDIVRVILEHQPSVATYQDNAGVTPLDLALSAMSEELCRLLIEKGACWHDQLVEAIYRGDANLVRFMLRVIAEPLNTISERLPRSALACAVLSGHVGVTKMLLHEFDADPDEEVQPGSTLLHSTLKNELSYPHMAQALIEARANINAQDMESLTPLMRAVRNHRVDVMDMLLSHGASTNLVSNQSTALSMAIELGFVDGIVSLLSFGASSCAGFENKGGSAICYCALTGRLHLIPMILQVADTSIDSKGSDGCSALYVAVLQGNTAAVTFLLGNGAAANQSDTFGNTALLRSVEMKAADCEIVRALIEHGASVTQSNADGMSPLDTVAETDDSRKAEMLLAAMASTAECRGMVESALRLALEAGSFETARVLIQFAVNFHTGVLKEIDAMGIAISRADLRMMDFLLDSEEAGGEISVNSRSGHQLYSLLHWAIVKKHNNVLEHLLQKPNLLVDIRDVSGGTPLHLASFTLNAEAATALLEARANVNARNEDGITPLSLATQRGHSRRVGSASTRTLRMMEILLDRGASPGAGGEKALTPLHVAAQHGNVECANLLLRKGSLPGHCFNDLGETPLHAACYHERVEVVRLLLPLLTPKQIDKHKKGGETGLLMAIRDGNEEIVDLLLKHGASPRARGADGMHPLSCAACQLSTSCSASIVRSLLSSGADPGIFDDEGVQPIHRACTFAEGDGGVLRALLDDPRVSVNNPCPGYHFALPIHLAAWCGGHSAVRVLTSVKGCLLEERAAKDRRTPLATAVGKGHTESVRALLEAGAKLDVLAYDDTGNVMSLVHEAVFRGHGDICRLLLQAMAMERKVSRLRDT